VELQPYPLIRSYARERLTENLRKFNGPSHSRVLMESVIQNLRNEVADNWPAFTYITMMIAFTFLFFRERRAEARHLRQMGERIQENISNRFDRLESIVRHPSTAETTTGRASR
jgi:hypothetical protein